jgi:hypothetical protein
MYSAYILRVGSQILSAAMGGMAVFSLYYAAVLPEPHSVCLMLAEALKWGGVATIIVYCQDKYLGS